MSFIIQVKNGKLRQPAITKTVYSAKKIVLFDKINLMKLVQFESLFIRHFQTTVWPFPLHNHNHYELMLISDGNGTHELNKQINPYSGNTIFILSPEDTHDFNIETETQFRVIKFLPSVLNGGINPSTSDYWSYLLMHLVRKWNSRVKNTNEDILTTKIITIIDLMINEWKDNEEKVSEIHTNLLRSLLLLMDRHLKDTNNTAISHYGETQIERIQNYIHSHIHFPDKLTVKYLSSTFGLSESGLRGLFKKQMEMSMGSYINALKIETIKNRIRNSTHSLSEIALEFGFTDSSHFSKFFQKHTGIKPLNYKRIYHINKIYHPIK